LTPLALNIVVLSVNVACVAWTAVAIHRVVRIYSRYLRLLAQEKAKLDALRKGLEELEYERENVRRMLGALPEESTIRAVIRWCWETQDKAAGRRLQLSEPAKPNKSQPS
jgi:hypothetical protein